MTWRLPDREDRQVAVLWAICALSAFALRPLWVRAAAFLPDCPWHAWTGWPCPGCGTTRAILRLLKGDLSGALAMNPLAAIGASVFLAGGAAAPVWIACGGRAPTLAMRPRPVWSAAVVLGVVANWVWLACSGV